MNVFKYLWVAYVTEAVCARICRDIPKAIRMSMGVYKQICNVYRSLSQETDHTYGTGPLDKIGF